MYFLFSFVNKNDLSVEEDCRGNLRYVTLKYTMFGLYVFLHIVNVLYLYIYFNKLIIYLNFTQKFHIYSDGIK